MTRCKIILFSCLALLLAVSAPAYARLVIGVAPGATLTGATSAELDQLAEALSQGMGEQVPADPGGECT